MRLREAERTALLVLLPETSSVSVVPKLPHVRVVAPKVWHDLPDSIRSSDSITTFERT